MGFGLLGGCSQDGDSAVSAVEQLSQKAFSPNVWFEVAANGDVNINIAKAEMGQHIGTALARIVADELGADWSRVSLTQEELDALPMMMPSKRRLIGKPTPALDIPEKTRGAAVYGIDVERPDMVYARPVMPPTRYGCTVKSVDDTEARKVSGFQQHLVIDDPSEQLQGWVVVVADSYPAAIKAADALSVTWNEGPGVNVSEADILAEGARLCADRSHGALFVDDGDIEQAADEAAASHTAIYRTASALHFALEPANAVAESSDGKWHIHAGNQWQSLILPVLAKALEVEETEVIIHQYWR